MAEKRPERLPTDTSPGANYTHFRNEALDMTTVGLAVRGCQEIPVPIVLSILMEFGYPGASASLFADVIADRVSMLFSNGGALLGGGLHEEVRRAVLPCFEAAKRTLSHLTPTTSFPVPGPGHVAFYLLTTSGVLTGGVSKDDLGEDCHPLSPLYHSGHEVLTQLRLRSQ